MLGMHLVALFALLPNVRAIFAGDMRLLDSPVQEIFEYPPTVGPSKLTGKLPALGWNTWNAYGCNISDTKVLAAGHQFISLGLKDSGYEYINIDDCWAEKVRDESTGKMVPHSTRFPNGISAVSKEIHDLGLKVGIYSDAGTYTCAGYPGSLSYETVDAATFAEWEIDYLKYDNCYVPDHWTDSSTPEHGDWYNSNSSIRFRRMGAALVAQMRPIQYSLCIWGEAKVWTWGGKVGHSWRMTGDASPKWSYITDAIEFNSQHLDAVGFYAHNDIDMMEIGNGNLTIEEERTHFAAWAFMKSPILLGTDLSKLSREQLVIITNKDLLAFNQDTEVGSPARPFTPYARAQATSPPEYYTGASSHGIHVFIINTSDAPKTKKFKFENVPGLGSGPYKVYDMWTGTDMPATFSKSFSIKVAPHDTVAFLIKSTNLVLQ